MKGKNTQEGSADRQRDSPSTGTTLMFCLPSVDPRRFEASPLLDPCSSRCWRPSHHRAAPTLLQGDCDSVTIFSFKALKWLLTMAPKPHVCPSILTPQAAEPTFRCDQMVVELQCHDGCHAIESASYKQPFWGPLLTPSQNSVPDFTKIPSPATISTLAHLSLSLCSFLGLWDPRICPWALLPDG